MVKEINRSKEKDQICKCGKSSIVHATVYPDEDTCEHLYFCNECWWIYEKTPRQMMPWQIAQKQKDIISWKKLMGYK